MAEIKSTLELVMERTRHMTLTEEDKKKQALAEFKSNLTGLLQKVQDEVLSPERFKADLRTLEESLDLNEPAVILEALSSRLDIDGDNTWLLNLLSEAFGASTAELAAICREYQQALESLTQTRTNELTRELLARHGIGGSAVVPNCAADPDLAAARERLRACCAPALRQAMAGVKITA